MAGADRNARRNDGLVAKNWSALLLPSLAIELAVLGCGAPSRPLEPVAPRVVTPAVDGPLASFPTRERMNALVAALPEELPRREVGPIVSRWEIEAESLEGAPGPFEPVAEALVAAAPALRIARPARCAAREVARFVAAHGELPNAFLGDYLVGRCGSTALRASLAVRAFRVSGYDEARLTREVHDDLVEGWRSLASVPHRGALGVASVRVGSRVVVGLVVEPERAVRFDLEGAPTPVEGRVRLSGRFDGDAEELLVLASKGLIDVAVCTSRLDGPALSVDCPFEPGDETAFIEVITREPGRLVPRTGARIVAVASPVAGLVYEERANERDLPDEPLAAVAQAINAHRSRLGRGPLTLESTQSSANRDAARVFFSATSAETQETAVLYAMAGWDVEGTLVGGNALAFELPAGLSPDRWTAYVLRHPFERYALLDPDASRIAVGVLEGPSSTFAMIGTYELIGPADPEDERSRVLATIQRARAEAGRPPAVLLPRIAALTRWSARVTAGAATPREALDRAMREAGPIPGARATMVLALHDLDRWPVPAEVRDAAALDLAVGHYRPEGAAWAQYIVLVVLG